LGGWRFVLNRKGCAHRAADADGAAAGVSGATSRTHARADPTPQRAADVDGAAAGVSGATSRTDARADPTPNVGCAGTAIAVRTDAGAGPNPNVGSVGTAVCVWGSSIDLGTTTLCSAWAACVWRSIRAVISACSGLQVTRAAVVAPRVRLVSRCAPRTLELGLAKADELVDPIKRVARREADTGRSVASWSPGPRTISFNLRAGCRLQSVEFIYRSCTA